MHAKIAIVSPGEVMSHLRNNGPYTIIDARPHSRYLAGHIPGAVWMGWAEWCETAPAHAGEALAQAGYWGVLKAEATALLQKRLGQAGLSNEQPILVYAEGPISKGREGRIAWMLLYWGASSVFLLDGGWQGWLRSGGVSDLAISTFRNGQFQIQTQEQRRVQLSQLRQDLQRNSLPLLIDVRSEAEFAGYDHAYQPRMGRLPGAVHMPFTHLFDETGNFVTQHVYLQRLPEKIRMATRHVAYCEVGARSCLFALLHEVYTGQVVANFDGSVMEWALDKLLPMEGER